MRYTAFLILIFTLSSCDWFGNGADPKPKPDEKKTAFSKTPVTTPINFNDRTDISGLIPSYTHPDALWSIEDNLTKPRLDLIGKNGELIKTVDVGVHNRDWEAIAITPGKDGKDKLIYIGDIGDNNEHFDEYYIYRFPEPQADQTYIENIDAIPFIYADSLSYDAETLLVDPETYDIYIITKRQLNVKVFRLAYPQKVGEINVAEYMGSIKYWGITTGDISIKGDEILLKSYVSVFYWKRKAGESIFDALSRDYDLNPFYIVENQGEAICWDQEVKGFYTLTEGARVGTPLYYYQKIEE